MSRSLATCRTAALCLATTLLVACGTTYSWRASVPLHDAVGESCMSKVLAEQDDVFAVAHTGVEQYAFRLRLPDQDDDDAHSFSLHRTRDNNGDPALTLATSYDESFFSDSIDLRERARELIVTITETCTGLKPELASPHPCGAGEEHDLCLEGHY
jgi:hypothetical protein